MGKKIRNLIGFLVVLLSFTGCSSVELNVKEENVKVEYGKEISVKAEDYLLNDKDVLSKVEVSSDIVNEEGKDYPAIGEYTLTFNYKEQEIEVKVSVADTTNPVFVEFKDTAETYQNCEVDFSVLYSAEDLSGVTLSYDDTKVDYTTGGTYTATVTATDGSGNSETKEVSVHVIVVSVQLDKTSASVYTGETVPLVATINIPEEKATFTSSDETVATVDENGLVTGVKTGKAIITAEINGIRAECEVTVSEKSNTSKPTGSTNKKPSTNAGTITNNSSSNNSTTSNNSSNNNQSSIVDTSHVRYAYATENTYVYMYADTKDLKYGTLYKGQGIHIEDVKTTEEGDWYLIIFDNGRSDNYNSEFGYVQAEYLTEPVKWSGNEELTEVELVSYTSREAFNLINAERIKLGLKPAVWDAECEEIALWRAIQLGELDRVTQENAHAGFDEWQSADFDNRWMITECVAWGCGNAGAAVTNWMYSPGHWNTLMDPDHIKMIVAYCGGRWVAVLSQ